jgi:elongator complex protein 3
MDSSEVVMNEEDQNSLSSVDFFQEIINYVIESKPDKRTLMTKKIEFCKKHKVKKVPTDIEILLNAKQSDLPLLKKYLQTKPVRTISGVAVVAVMTKPFPCPHGRCTMCPGGINSHFGTVPQSYTGHEPATMRGIRNNYDSYLQVFNRLEQYIVIGQNPDKVDLILMGGTFPFTPARYQDEFVIGCFKAMNDFSNLFYDDGEFNLNKFREFFELPGEVGSKSRTESVQKKLLALKEENKVSLEEEQIKNETSNIRCIGLTIETKPDYAQLKHANQMLRLGCTRVELGVQSVYDDALKKINRGHTVAETISAIKTLKDLGFKINYHMMTGLPDIDVEKDVESLKEIFTNDAYKPDMIKIYPCMVMPGTPLYDDWKKGLFVPQSTQVAAEVIARAKKYVPEYVRIMRVQRDIPTKMSVDGVDKNNLRQIIDDRLKDLGYACRCIRCREIKNIEVQGIPILKTMEFSASDGKEFFISFDTEDDKLIGFCRLRFPGQSLREEIPDNSAIIRELHVYGTAVAIGKPSEDKAQHKGFGRRLMDEAERVAKVAGKTKMIVISGVGVREYYKKLGYHKEGPYMVKML